MSKLIADTKKFVLWHLGRGAFAPHTGQDWPAWGAFVHLAQCWTCGGGIDAVNAMRATLLCAQPTEAVLSTFVQAIPAVGDWCHVRELWPQIAGAIVLRGTTRTARELAAVERHVDYDARNKPIPGTDRIRLHGLQTARESHLGVVP